jgi:hypothetical protein
VKAHRPCVSPCSRFGRFARPTYARALEGLPAKRYRDLDALITTARDEPMFPSRSRGVTER